MIASFFYNHGSNDLYTICWKTILPASFALAILNGASNALNQVTDLKTDKISKPYRPIPQGYISIREALAVSVILYVSAIILAIIVNTVFTLFILLIIAITITYSLPPRLKNHLFFNQIWVGVPRGLLGVLASWSVFGNVMQPLPIVIGLIAMFFMIGGSITKDITDSEADKKTGTKTLINTYGVKNAAVLVLPLMFFPFAFIPMLIDSGILESYLWSLTLLAIPSYLIFHLMIRDKTKSRFFENTSSWTLMYVTYFVFALGFSVLTIQNSIA
jgi:4-hydroxybenzoate polyprenyltransferase